MHKAEDRALAPTDAPTVAPGVFVPYGAASILMAVVLGIWRRALRALRPIPLRRPMKLPMP